MHQSYQPLSYGSVFTHITVFTLESEDASTSVPHGSFYVVFRIA
jgi:hypothetical protein